MTNDELQHLRDQVSRAATAGGWQRAGRTCKSQMCFTRRVDWNTVDSFTISFDLGGPAADFRLDDVCDRLRKR